MFCLPCRRSRVRIPSAASRKACICRSFSLRQSPCSSASGRTDSGLAVRRSSAASRKRPGLQADSRSSELKSFCRPAEGRVFRLLLRLAGCSCKRHVLAHGRPPTRWPAIPILGASPISVRKPRGRPSSRTATPASHGSYVTSSPQTASEAAARCPSRAAWAVLIARGSIAEAVAYIGSGRLLATGLGSCSSVAIVSGRAIGRARLADQARATGRGAIEPVILRGPTLGR